MCHGPACPAVPNEYGESGSRLSVATATSCSLRSARIVFGLTMASGELLLWAPLDKPTLPPGACEGIELLSILKDLLMFDALSGFCVLLHEGVFSERAYGGQEEMNQKLWRYRLIPARCRALPGRYRDEVLRCAATRRHTSRTGVVSGSANLEKTGSFAVKILNNWPVFQCTVNWSRARHS